MKILKISTGDKVFLSSYEGDIQGEQWVPRHVLNILSEAFTGGQKVTFEQSEETESKKFAGATVVDEGLKPKSA